MRLKKHGRALVGGYSGTDDNLEGDVGLARFGQQRFRLGDVARNDRQIGVEIVQHRRHERGRRLAEAERDRIADHLSVDAEAAAWRTLMSLNGSIE